MEFDSSSDDLSVDGSDDETPQDPEDKLHTEGLGTGGQRSQNSVAPAGLGPGPDILPGDRLGRYILQEKLGEGGMGAVYKAYDPELDRRVALKVHHLKPEKKNSRPEARDRMIREAQALAQLSHPNVISVFDVGALGDEVFIAMELVEGPTLRQLLDKPDRDWRKLLKVLTDAGRGLAAAHKVGLVHRDFKPDNVIAGVDGRVRVLDFGLARPIRSDSGEASDSGRHEEEALSGSGDSLLHSNLTRAGIVVGTPMYMAPEQHRGHEVDSRSDQFAFGVALYEVLYGERPFSGGSRRELIQNILHSRIRPPDPENEVPVWLQRIVHKALAPSPEKRFSSMDALLEELGRDPAIGRWRLIRTISVGLLALVAIIALWWGFRQGSRCENEGALRGAWDPEIRARIQAAFLATRRPNAADTWERVERILDGYAGAWLKVRLNACEATHVRGEQSETLLDLRMRCLNRRRDRLRALVGLFAEANDVLDKAVQAALGLEPIEACEDTESLVAATPPPADPVVRKEVTRLQSLLDKAAALEEAGHVHEAEPLAREIVSNARPLAYPPLTAEALLRRASLEQQIGSWQNAQVTLRQALDEATRAHDPTLITRILIELAWIHGYRMTQFDYGLGLAVGAETTLALAGQKPNLWAHLERTVGGIYAEKADYARALERYERAEKILRESLGAEHPEVAKSLCNQGAVLEQQGDHARARVRLERCAEVLIAALGARHPSLGIVYSNLGLVLAGMGQLGEARKFLERSVWLYETSLGSNHPETAMGLNNLGDLLKKQGELGLAQERLERARAIWEQALGKDHADVAYSLDNLAQVATYRADFAAAEKLFARTLAIRESALGSDHPQTASTVSSLGWLALEKGEVERAVALERDALARLHRSGTDPQAEVNLAQLVLGQALKRQGRLDDARAMFERILAATRQIDPECLAMALEELGEMHLAHGRGADAIAHLERAESLLVPDEGDQAISSLAHARFLLARALMAAGDRARAFRLARQALDALVSTQARIFSAERRQVEAFLARRSSLTR